MVHALLDVIVDGYFTAVERFDDYYDEVSDSIFSDTPLGPDQQRSGSRCAARSPASTGWWRPCARRCRPWCTATSTSWPRRSGPTSRTSTTTCWVSESADTLRDLVTSLVEANLSLRDYRQNQVMKKVSSWAAIIAVPTLVTGYYGMNVPFPGSGERMGVVVATGLIGGAVAVAVRAVQAARLAVAAGPSPRAAARGCRSRPGSIWSAQRSAGAGSTTTREVVAGHHGGAVGGARQDLAGADPGAGAEALDPAAADGDGRRRATTTTPRGHARPAGPGGAGRGGRGGRRGGRAGRGRGRRSGRRAGRRGARTRRDGSGASRCLLGRATVAAGGTGMVTTTSAPPA